MKLTLLAVGKLREPWCKQGCEEYAKRVRARLPLEIVEVKRGSEVGRRIPASHRVWALDERGREFSSGELAQVLGRLMSAGEHGLALVLGGADGLGDLSSWARPPELTWSLSRLTLPHRLARLVVLEQLYRALSILRGEPYHRS